MTQPVSIYAHTRLAALENLGIHIEGSPQALFLAIVDDDCTTPLRDAIEKAAKARGYKDGVTWLQPWADNAALSEREMFEVIEALDPLCVVALGANAAALFEAVYHIEKADAERIVALGRPACLIENATELMASEEGRQHLWALIKSLPEKH